MTHQESRHRSRSRLATVAGSAASLDLTSALDAFGALPSPFVRRRQGRNLGRELQVPTQSCRPAQCAARGALSMPRLRALGPPLASSRCAASASSTRSIQHSLHTAWGGDSRKGRPRTRKRGTADFYFVCVVWSQSNPSDVAGTGTNGGRLLNGWIRTSQARTCTHSNIISTYSCMFLICVHEKALRSSRGAKPTGRSSAKLAT